MKYLSQLLLSIVKLLRLSLYITLIKNTPTSYGLIAICIHWFMAFGIFFLFGLGLYMVELSYYDSWYKGSLDLHKSIGVSLFLIWCFRLLWRWTNVNPEPLSAKNKLEKFEHVAAHWMHVTLYLVMVMLMLSGYLISTADGRSVVVFDLFEIPAIPASIENQEDIAGEIHYTLAWVLISLVAMHALAALKHHLVDKDDTLKKMILFKKQLKK